MAVTSWYNVVEANVDVTATQGSEFPDPERVTVTASGPPTPRISLPAVWLTEQSAANLHSSLGGLPKTTDVTLIGPRDARGYYRACAIHRCEQQLHDERLPNAIRKSIASMLNDGQCYDPDEQLPRRIRWSGH